MKGKDLKDIINKTAEKEPEVDAPAMAKPKGREVFTLTLNENDKEKVREKARAIVAAKFKKQAEEKLLAQYVEEIERESIPEQQVEPILINVAGHSNKISLDGRPYFQGHVYNVTQRERETLEEIMDRTWKHEKEVGGANFDHYRKPANAVLRPGSELRPIHSLVSV